ncbi:MAG: glycosyltransferase family 2 protein [Pseudomonadota bacterium]
MNPTRGSDHGNTSVRPAGLAAVDPGLLRLAGPVHLDPDATPCVLLVHNEMAVLPELLDHYRRCGPVSFLVVEDRSTDATPAFLAAQPDVTVFHPAAGTATAPTSAAGAVRSSTPSPRADGRSSPTPTNSSIIPASSTAASPLSSPTSTARGPRRSTPPWSTCMPTARLQTTSMRGGGASRRLPALRRSRLVPPPRLAHPFCRRLPFSPRPRLRRPARTPLQPPRRPHPLPVVAPAPLRPPRRFLHPGRAVAPTLRPDPPRHEAALD